MDYITWLYLLLLNTIHAICASLFFLLFCNSTVVNECCVFEPYIYIRYIYIYIRYIYIWYIIRIQTDVEQRNRTKNKVFNLEKKPVTLDAVFKLVLNKNVY